MNERLQPIARVRRVSREVRLSSSVILDQEELLANVREEIDGLIGNLKQFLMVRHQLSEERHTLVQRRSLRKRSSYCSIVSVVESSGVR